MDYLEDEDFNFEDGDIEDGDIEDGDIEDGDIEDGDIEDIQKAYREENVKLLIDEYGLKISTIKQAKLRLDKAKDTFKIDKLLACKGF